MKKVIHTIQIQLVEENGQVQMAARTTADAIETMKMLGMAQANFADRFKAKDEATIKPVSLMPSILN